MRTAPLLALFCLLGCGAPAPQGPLPLVEARCPKSALAKAPKLNRKSDSRALRCALLALRAHPEDAAQSTELPSRLVSWLAERTPQPDRARLADEGATLAEEALARGAPEGPVRYYLALNRWIGATPAARPQLCSALKPHLEAAIAQSPLEDEAGPLRLMGQLYLTAPPWPRGMGDREIALQHLRRAYAEAPNHPLNGLYLARALHQEGASPAEVARLVMAARLNLRPIVYGEAAFRWGEEIYQLERELGFDDPETLPDQKAEEAQEEGEYQGEEYDEYERRRPPPVEPNWADPE